MKITLFRILLLIASLAGLVACSEDNAFVGTTDGSVTGTSTATATYIDVKAAPNLVGTNSTSDVSVTLYDNVGDPVPDALLNFSVSVNNSLDATMGIGIAKTDSSGVATLTYTSGSTGGVVDTVLVSGAGLSGTVDIGVQTAVANISTVTITANPPLPQFVAGTSGVTLDIAVKDTNGTGVANLPVSLILLGDGSLGGTSVTTDAQGLATQSLTIPTRLTTGSATITAQVVSSTGVKTATLSLSFINAPAADITLSASPESIGLQDTGSIKAVVRDQYGNPVPSAELTFTVDATARVSTAPTFTDSGGFSSSTGTIKTDATGTATIDYNADAAVAGIDRIIATTTTSAGVVVQNTFDMTITAVSTTIGSVSVNALSSSVTADGTSGTAVQATVKDISGQLLEGETVGFSSSAGTLSAATAVTNAAGVATVTLTSSVNLATAFITASDGGYSDNTSVDFVPGPIASGFITALPATLPADGTTTSTITVGLLDAWDHPVADGTPAQLQQDLTTLTDAKITSANPTTTTGGRATFTLQAATSAGSDNLYLFQLNTIKINMTYGADSPTAGEPANIKVTSDRTQISVAGVGKEESATVSLTVVDAIGNPIPDTTFDNIRVSLVTKPNAGEYISGTSNPVAPVPVDSVATGNITIFTSAGATSFGIQSGTLPGIVEILVEVLDDTGATVISATVPQITIASGPPHSINFTLPNTDAVIKYQPGVYQRKGSVIVADRYGNAVADGTVVNLGMIDTVIASNNDGDTLTAANALTSVGVDLSLASVTRNGITRFIQKDDRVLLLDAISGDKSRFAAGTAADSNTLPVQSTYTGGEVGRSYIVGSTELGATIAGVDSTGSLTTGYVQTTNGVGEIRITYPANTNTIHSGCYLTLDAPDSRTLPVSSSDVYVIGSASNTSATNIEGRFCFSSILPWSLSNDQPVAMEASGSVILKLRDGGDSIALPFIALKPYISISSPLISVTAAPCITDIDGQCTASIGISGSSGETATVTYAADDYPATTAIDIKIP